MSRKHKRRRKPNIKNDPAYNPFPKSGLVKQYEPYIRKVGAEFCRRYPDIRRDDFLYRAIELANAAEKTSSPTWGMIFQPISADLRGTPPERTSPAARPAGEGAGR